MKSSDRERAKNYSWIHPIAFVAVVVSDSRQCRILVAGPSRKDATAPYSVKETKIQQDNHIERNVHRPTQTQL